MAGGPAALRGYVLVGDAAKPRVDHPTIQRAEVELTDHDRQVCVLDHDEVGRRESVAVNAEYVAVLRSRRDDMLLAAM